ncbi:MAG: hypothetical protein IAI48_16960 [Candidatus Eremiobacteraeota bacterium]|nr:hypothetical protein [Candidatus Eremiobacteraeota bacterium]
MASFVRAFVVPLLVCIVALACTDVFVRAAFPTTERLSDNFSSAYLRMVVDRMRDEPRQVVILGDSVLWGYRLRADESAPAVLARAGVANVNLSYEGGSPANTYAMLRYLLARGVRPGIVVFNVNQKTFNAADSAYATLHPSVSALARPFIASSDAALLAPAPSGTTFDARLDRDVASVWRLYAIRTDVRELFFGDIDAAHALHDVLETATGAKARNDAAHAPTPDKFEGTYDLAPLDDGNVSVRYLSRTIETLCAYHIRALAILTPTNHTLLHEYIDNPQYERNLAFVRTRLERGGVRVVNLDRAFGDRDFFDNDHLTAAANRRLAHDLATELTHA